MGKIKSPKPDQGKKITPPDEGGPTDHLHPYFCVSHLARGFCVLDCDTKEQASFARALREIGSRTWNELKQASRKGAGFETIYQMKKEVPSHAKGRRMISFRVGGIYRLVGYREQQIFHILWVDPKGDSYSH